MALLHHLVNSGYTRRQAAAIGRSYESVVQTGSALTAPTVSGQVCRVQGSIGAAGFIKLPPIEQSQTGEHLVINATAFDLTVSATDTLLLSGGSTSVIPAQGKRMFLACSLVDSNGIAVYWGELG